MDMTTTSAVEPYTFPVTGQDVRTLEIAGDPWFVATDVCAVLELAETHRAIANLDEDEKDRHTVTTPGGDQRVSIVNEPGLYSLILRSRKPEAKAFKRWITHEVLPALRKTGSYAVAEQPGDDLDAIQSMITALRADRQRIAAVETTQDRQAEQQRELNARLDGIEGRHDWFSALGYARMSGLPTERRFLQRLGTAAGRITRRDGHQPAKTQHALFGAVNTYPVTALDEAADLIAS